MENIDGAKKQILRYLLNGGRLTRLDAFKLFGTFKLPARIHDLIKEGHPIKKQWVVTPNTHKRVMQYSYDFDLEATDNVVHS